MSTQPSNIPRYFELLQSLDMTGISILSIKASRKPDFKRPVSGTLVMNTDVKLEALTAKTLDALVESKVEGLSEAKESQFTCEIKVRASYAFVRQKPGLTDDQDLVARFVGTNVLVNVWPFLRDYISWLSTNMGIGATLIPLLKTRVEPPKDDEA